MELLLNVFVGIVSGCVSGFIVSYYFSQKEAREQWKRDFSDDKQTMAKYISLVIWELDQLMEGNGRETKDLQKLLQSPPHFKSFQLEKIKPEHHMRTATAYNLFREIDEYLKNDVPNETYQLPKLQYMQFRIRLLKAQWDILMINKEVVDHTVNQDIREE